MRSSSALESELSKSGISLGNPICERILEMIISAIVHVRKLKVPMQPSIGLDVIDV